MVQNKFNPWHDVEPKGEQEGIINGIVEIPQGTRAKYELDKKSGLLKLDRVIYSSVYYPANYGFIPKSYGEDNDPLDILILTQINVVPLCIVPAKVIGVMQMWDNGEADDKLIAVAAGDPSFNHIEKMEELAPHFIAELQAFFEDYKKLEKKEVRVSDFLGKEKALEILEKSFIRYNKVFKK